MKVNKYVSLILLLSFIMSFNPVVYSENIDPMGIDVYENFMTREEYYEQTIAQYNEYDYSDPQTTPDTELFGVWDSVTSTWTTEPLLDYENKEGLFLVETAAKTALGDYAECKKLLFDYYKEKFAGFNLVASSGSVQDYIKLTAEMRFENWTTRPALGPRPMSKLLVSENHREITASVIDAVSGIIGASDKRATIHLYALKKDGYVAVFDSSDGDNSPYIEVTVNGVARKFYPVEDTYVSAGNNESKNYSSENKLLAEESYSSIGLLSAVNEYTRRTVLKFDFSSINDTDEVTAAVLHIYGHMEESDDPVDSGIDKTGKVVFVLNDTSGNLWSEENLTWKNYFATASWVCLCYDGTDGYINESISEYFPGVVKYRSSIMGMTHALNEFTNYYFVTKDETFGYHLIRETMHKIRELNCDFDSTEQPTLNLIRVQQLIKIMDKTMYSKHMTPEIFVTFLKSCYEHAEAIVGSERFSDCRDNIWTTTVKNDNIGALQTTALLEVAVAFDEFKAANAPLGTEWREDAFNGGWKEVAKNRYEQCIEKSVYVDGAATDLPISYVWTNLNNYINVLDNYPVYYGCDVSGIFGDGIRDILINVAEYVSNVISPKLGTWQVGDGANFASAQNRGVRRIANLWPKDVSELVKYIGSGRINGNPPDYTSYASDTINRAVLRSDWSEDAVAMHIHSSSNNNHTHYDDLAVTLFAYGDYLLADPLTYDYSTTNPITLWQKSREAHNCVVIDGENPRRTGGSAHPENREFNDVYDFIWLDSEGYENQSMNRFICFVKPGYFIITDQITSTDEETHSYSQNWHFKPDARISLDNEKIQTKTNHKSGANLIVADVSENGETSATIKTGYYSQSANSSQVENYQYVSYTKETSGSETFQTLLYPTQIGESADVQTEVLESSISATNVRAMRAIINDSNIGEIITNYYILMNDNLKTDATYGTYKTDGAMALSEFVNDKISVLALRKGSYIEDTSTGIKFLQLKQEVGDLGITVDDSIIHVASSKENILLEGLTMYVGKKNISEFIYNGEIVDFNRSGDYIYVGDSPAYELPKEEVSDNKDTEQKDDGVYVPKEEIGTGAAGGSGSTSSSGPSGSLGGTGSAGSSSNLNSTNNSEDKLPKPDEKLSEQFEKELSGHWAEIELADMIDSGWVKGKDGTLALSDNITRAEFISVIVRALDLDTESYQSIFTDVNKDDWFANDLETAYRNGILNGYDGKAEPNAPITREQMAKILVNAHEFVNGPIHSKDKKDYKDSSMISDWAEKYIDKCTYLALMNGYPDGSFGPMSTATRAEAFVTIYRLVDNNQ